MDGFSRYSDPIPFGSSSSASMSIDYYPEHSSLSDGSSSRGAAHNYSDEEGTLLLATSCPKKRAGRRIFKETRHPVYRGVRRRNGDKWVCEVREPNTKSRIWLGTYPTPEMAARAQDVAALALRGKSACLNFADSAWRLPVPASKNASDIRKAASEAAELFRPRAFGGDCDDDHHEEVMVMREHRVVEDSVEVCSKECQTTMQGSTDEGGVLYMDEEAMFDMPGLLVDMAGGLLLSPPHYVGEDTDWNHYESDGHDLELWNYM
ncbi:hypothetical protein Tsubulata_021703 [Turnera subulata]|uniref:AP2/ERF domain-containing protein n=1 Tax=Turnera subulata TaxID=218843 RepID=A0A9Q0FQ28_9ROSI|nr:hypothetical protein Tsubulata_021703 [Turnera subulata]